MDSTELFAWTALIILVPWTAYWKIRALVYAWKGGQLGWFLALIFINTLGIFPIIFIYKWSRHYKELQNDPTNIMNKTV